MNYRSIEDVLEAVLGIIEEQNTVSGEESFIRLSASGSCARKIAYGVHFPHHKQPDSVREMSVFDLGDLLHDAERDLIRQVVHLHSEEKEVFLRVELPGGQELAICGHIDGIIELEGGPAIIDVKTASDAGFSKMLKEGVPEHYAAQVNAYMEATGIERGYLWVYNKNTSERRAFPVPYDPRLVAEVKGRFARVIESAPDRLPEPEYQAVVEIRGGQPTGREYLPWQCTYCPFVAACRKPEGFEPLVEKGKTRWIRTVDTPTAKARGILGSSSRAHYV